jgi:hypothetical protein
VDILFLIATEVAVVEHLMIRQVADRSRGVVFLGDVDPQRAVLARSQASSSSRIATRKPFGLKTKGRVGQVPVHPHGPDDIGHIATRSRVRLPAIISSPESNPKTTDPEAPKTVN